MNLVFGKFPRPIDKKGRRYRFKQSLSIEFAIFWGGPRMEDLSDVSGLDVHSDRKRIYDRIP
jgi:hypothetical protein